MLCLVVKLGGKIVKANKYGEGSSLNMYDPSALNHKDRPLYRVDIYPRIVASSTCPLLASHSQPGLRMIVHREFTNKLDICNIIVDGFQLNVG